MTIKEWTEKTTIDLHHADISTAELDAEVLLCDELDKDKSWIHAHGDFELSEESVKSLDKKIERRKNHEPIAYIRGRQEFYGRDFFVSPATLTPRPETETLIESALQILASNNISSVADIGTGSGCIIITLQLEHGDSASYYGCDISEDALTIAKKNAKNLSSNVTFEIDDITKDEQKSWADSDLIVANLPYVPSDFQINLAATHEPDFAIYGGSDGLKYYQFLFKKLTLMNRFVITEALPPQHESLAKLASAHGYKLLETNDLIQLFKRV